MSVTICRGDSSDLLTFEPARCDSTYCAAKLPAGSIGYGSAQVGTFAVQAARLAMFTGAIVDIGELSAAVTALLYTASTESGEARAQAVESLKELAVYGAMEWLATRKTSKKRDRGQTSESADSSSPTRPDSEKTR